MIIGLRSLRSYRLVADGPCKLSHFILETRPYVQYRILLPLLCPPYSMLLYIRTCVLHDHSHVCIAIVILPRSRTTVTETLAHKDFFCT